MEIRPRPGGGLTHAQARHITPYGMAECSWKIEDGKIHLNVLIPPNTTALVRFPGSNAAPVEVGSGTWHWSVDYQDPDARGPFTVNDLIGDIMSEPTAGSAIMEVLAQVGMPEFLRAVIFGELNVPLRQPLRMLPNYEHAVKLMEDALADL
jgi:alpha-L-rhamnosidase